MQTIQRLDRYEHHKKWKKRNILRRNWKNTTIAKVHTRVQNGSMWNSNYHPWWNGRQQDKQISCLQMTTKSFARLFQLHVNLIGMVNHGHGDGTYTRYAIDMWPKGSLPTRLKLKGIDKACTSCGDFVLIWYNSLYCLQTRCICAFEKLQCVIPRSYLMNRHYMIISRNFFGANLGEHCSYLVKVEIMWIQDPGRLIGDKVAWSRIAT